MIQDKLINKANKTINKNKMIRDKYIKLNKKTNKTK